MSSLPKRDWFQAGEGIAREVISADIQRYLGRDATVRPGYGVGEEEGVAGYWINAHRNLTTPQVEDLKRDSQSWLNERRSQDVSYANSSTFASSRGQTYHGQQHAPHAEPPRADYNHPQSAQSAYQYPQQYPQTEPAQTGYTYNQGQAPSYYSQNSGYTGYAQPSANQAASQAAQPRQYNYQAAAAHPQAAAYQYQGYTQPSTGYQQTNPQQPSNYSHGQPSAPTQYNYPTPTTQPSSQTTYQYTQQGYQQQQQPSYSYQQQPPQSGRRRQG